MSSAAQRLAFKELSQELADILLAATEYRREGNTWYFPSRTDKHETEHRVDIHCSCVGFAGGGYCGHITKAIELAKAARRQRAKEGART